MIDVTPLEIGSTVLRCLDRTPEGWLPHQLTTDGDPIYRLVDDEGGVWDVQLAADDVDGAAISGDTVVVPRAVDDERAFLPVTAFALQEVRDAAPWMYRGSRLLNPTLAELDE